MMKFTNCTSMELYCKNKPSVLTSIERKGNTHKYISILKKVIVLVNMIPTSILKSPGIDL